MIGWDKLGNITVVQESNSSGEDLSSRLENIERWTKSTHNICLVQSLDRWLPISSLAMQWLDESKSLTQMTGFAMVKLYVFNTTLDNQLPELERLNTKSLVPVERTISAGQQTIAQTLTALFSVTFEPYEQSQWLINIFEKNPLRLTKLTLSPTGLLTVGIEGIQDIASAQSLLMKESITKTMMQFPEVHRVLFE